MNKFKSFSTVVAIGSIYLSSPNNAQAQHKNPEYFPSKQIKFTQLAQMVMECKRMQGETFDSTDLYFDETVAGTPLWCNLKLMPPDDKHKEAYFMFSAFNDRRTLDKETRLKNKEERKKADAYFKNLEFGSYDFQSRHYLGVCANVEREVNKLYAEKKETSQHQAQRTTNK